MYKNRRVLPVGDFSGARLRGHRERQRPRMSRARLAELIGVSEDMVKQYETRGGRPSVQTMLLLLRVLGIDHHGLIRTSDDDQAEYYAGLYWTHNEAAGRRS